MVSVFKAREHIQSLAFGVVLELECLLYAQYRTKCICYKLSRGKDCKLGALTEIIDIDVLEILTSLNVLKRIARSLYFVMSWLSISCAKIQIILEPPPTRKLNFAISDSSQLRSLETCNLSPLAACSPRLSKEPWPQKPGKSPYPVAGSIIAAARSCSRPWCALASYRRVWLR